MMFWAAPPRFDLSVIARLAKTLGTHPLVDLSVQSAISHNLLGGFWFAFELFILWTQGAQSGGEQNHRRLVRILLGSALAALLTLPAAALISWFPPNRNPALIKFYPSYLDSNPNTNSFPSQSTAVYTAIAAGVYSLRKRPGILLWFAVSVLVALPRMYVGGHYLTDIIAGFILGVAGYVLARNLDSFFFPRLQQAFHPGTKLWWLANALFFVWVLQVATEFRDIAWAGTSISEFLRYLTS